MALMMSLRDIFKRRQSYTRRQLEAWLQTLNIEAEAVADVGGKQLPVQDRVRSWHVKRYDLLDLPEYDLNQPWVLKETYDVVFCLEVFEYIYNPFVAMKNLHDMLKVGGVLYASFHFIYPHHSSKFIDYLRYTHWGVEKLLQEANFTSWQISPRWFKRAWLMRLVYFSEKVRGNNSNFGKLHREQGYLIRAQK
jgi:SAM-dependent methyltransferase